MKMKNHFFIVIVLLCMLCGCSTLHTQAKENLSSSKDDNNLLVLDYANLGASKANRYDIILLVQFNRKPRMGEIYEEVKTNLGTKVSSKEIRMERVDAGQNIYRIFWNTRTAMNHSKTLKDVIRIVLGFKDDDVLLIFSLKKDLGRLIENAQEKLIQFKGSFATTDSQEIEDDETIGGEELIYFPQDVEC